MLDRKEKVIGQMNIAEKWEKLSKHHNVIITGNWSRHASFQITCKCNIRYVQVHQNKNYIVVHACIFTHKSGHLWNDDGYCNYKHISEWLQASFSMCESDKCLKTFVECDIVTFISESAKLEKECHNKLKKRDNI